MQLVDGWWVPRDRLLNDQRHPVHSQQQDLGCIDRALAHAKLSPGWQCVQAGARVGLWPITLVERGAARVFAFEPEPANFACAQQNVLDRGLADKIVLRQLALGARDQHVRLAISKESGGEHFVGYKDARHCILVPQTYIDGLALEHCAAIFLDLEGYEIEALCGATKTLERCKPVVVVEENALCARYNRERGDAERFMRSVGYNLVDEFDTLPPELKGDAIFHGSDLIFAPQ